MNPPLLDEAKSAASIGETAASEPRGNFRVRRMREVATGVWHWKAAHPEWEPGQRWDRMVLSYGVDTGEDVLLFDPVDVPAELRDRASAVVLTCPWHRRDAPQLGLPIHVPPPDAPV